MMTISTVEDEAQAMEVLREEQHPENSELSVVIPAFNEQGAVRRTILEVKSTLQTMGLSSEVIVVDDGSTDNTAAEAKAGGARVIQLATNGGYGAALKRGIGASRSPWIAIIDADGTYPAGAIPGLFELARDQDMVVAARSENSAGIPLVRRPAKWFLTRLARYLAGRHIPDLNSGLRVFRRSALEQFLAVLPSGFSFTTTITLCMLCSDHRVAYQPIEYLPRVGSSKIRPFHFVSFVILVLRTIVLFNPLRVFLPLGSVLFVAGAAKFVYDMTQWNLSESAVMAFLAAIIVWSLGLLADMISRLHLRQHIAS